jgi:shikimate dehydrogenase
MSHRVGLIGDPVAHSKSPALHNAAFAYYGLDAHYELWPTVGDALADRVASLRAPDTFGANITLPHKIAVIPLLDRLDPLVDVIGAVNTIIREADGTLSGANTDAPAFLASLQEDAGYAPEGQTAVVLGASGAARAAVAALMSANIAGVVVVNRTVERAEELLADMLIAFDRDPHFVATTPDDPDLPTLFEGATLIVNATSLGWYADETPLDAALISPGALVYDMVYRPTRLLHEAAALGAHTHDGLGMLVRQAALAFERWTGKPGPLDVMRAAVKGKR